MLCGICALILRSVRNSSTIFGTRVWTLPYQRAVWHTLRVAQKSGETQTDREWSKKFVQRVGRTVKAARRGRSAKWLSDRTDELGFRIPATVISRLDSGHRSDVLSVPELLVLAAALEIPPALLMFPAYPDGAVDLLPQRQTTGYHAAKWLVGERTLPAGPIDRERGIHEAASNEGTALVGAVLERDRMAYAKFEADMRATAGDQQYLALASDLSSKLSAAESQIAYLRERLGIASADTDPAASG